MLAGAVDIWINHGNGWGLTAVFGSILVAFLFFFLEIRLLKTGPLARRFLLSGQTPPAEAHVAAGMAPGSKGRSLTRLNPSGLVEVEGRSLEALSRDGMIEEGAEVEIISDDSFRVLVRRARQG